MINFKEETLEKLPYFQEINVVSDLIKADPNLQDYNAEQALEALVAFNDDMKKLAVNAFQMEKLASYSLKENDLTLDWVNEMDDETIQIEEGLIRIERKLRRENLLKA